jgi:hypothetical protein
MSQIDTVFGRIERHSGEVFHQVRGAAFRYSIKSGTVVPDRTNQQIAKSQFAQALKLVPLAGPGQIQSLRGPSYIYAILMDPRIREHDW